VFLPLASATIVGGVLMSWYAPGDAWPTPFSFGLSAAAVGMIVVVVLPQYLSLTLRRIPTALPLR
jgi:hypothetical protein